MRGSPGADWCPCSAPPPPRRRAFLIRGLENTLTKFLLSLEFYDEVGRQKIAIGEWHLLAEGHRRRTAGQACPLGRRSPALPLPCNSLRTMQRRNGCISAIHIPKLPATTYQWKSAVHLSYGGMQLYLPCACAWPSWQLRPLLTLPCPCPHPAATSLVFSQKVGVLPEKTFAALTNDRLVAKGTVLEFITNLFKVGCGLSSALTSTTCASAAAAQLSPRPRSTVTVTNCGFLRHVIGRALRWQGSDTCPSP